MRTKAAPTTRCGPRTGPCEIRSFLFLAFGVLAGGATGLLGGCGRSSPAGSPPERVFGQTGLGPGDFSYPRGIAIAPDGRVFVVDKTARIQRFTPDGTFELYWQMPEWQAGKPIGLTVDSQGRLLVADTHYARVMIFDRQGQLLAQFGSKGDGPGQFVYPTSTAVDRDGTIYVSEYGGNDRISTFTAQYAYVSSFGGPDAGPASLSRPTGLAFDAEQTLWVADACNHRICRFSRDGKLLSAFGSMGSEPGQLRYPYWLCVGPDGNILVAEYGNNRVQMFTPTGKSLWTWGTAGREPGQLAYPWAVAVGVNRQVYVVDSGNNRIQVFRM